MENLYLITDGFTRLLCTIDDWIKARKISRANNRELCRKWAKRTISRPNPSSKILTSLERRPALAEKSSTKRRRNIRKSRGCPAPCASLCVSYPVFMFIQTVADNRSWLRLRYSWTTRCGIAGKLLPSRQNEHRSLWDDDDDSSVLR